MTTRFKRNSTCRRCQWNIEESVELEESLCDEVEAVGSSLVLVTG